MERDRRGLEVGRRGGDAEGIRIGALGGGGRVWSKAEGSVGLAFGAGGGADGNGVGVQWSAALEV